MIKEITGNLVVDYNVRDWCKLPYPGHKNGCPNYNKSDQCPPKVDIVENVYDLSKPHWFSIVEFNMKDHANRMKSLHPKWSDKQCRCCLYWQNTVRKKLRIECDGFIINFDNMSYTLIPEAMGVNVFRSMHRIGIKMRKPIEDKLYKVALIGCIKNHKLNKLL